MRVLIVHNFYQQPGGEDAVVRQEAALLREHGDTVSLFTVDNRDIRGLLGKMCTALLTVANPWAARALRRHIAQFRPDIVHVHNFFPQLSPSIFGACGAQNVPVVMTLHNFRILCPTSFLYHDAELREHSLHHSSFWTVLRRVYRRSAVGTAFVAAMVDFHKLVKTWHRKVDRFIALTHFARDKFVEGGLPANRFCVKGNAMPDRLGPPPPDAPRHGALFVGRLSEEKGLSVLLEAWRQTDYPLRIAGDGPMRAQCESAQTENIRLLGRLTSDQVQNEMRKAAFLVLPSGWYEMFPMTIVEAYQAGLPVITADLGGMKELIEPGITGLTFSPGDSDSLIAAVSWARHNPEKMRDMGRGARNRYEATYTSKQNYSRLVAIYRDVIAEHAAAGRLRSGRKAPVPQTSVMRRTIDPVQ